MKIIIFRIFMYGIRQNKMVKKLFFFLLPQILNETLMA